MISARRLIDWRMVLKLVSMPPSQRWFTNGCPQRSASFWTASRAERLVPTNSTVPPSAMTPLMKCAASAIQRLRLLEIDDVDLVALAEDERGHLRVPEAGLMSEMDTRFQHLSHGHAGHEKSPVRVEPPRIPRGHPGDEARKAPEPQRHPVDRLAIRVWVFVAKKGRALYHEDLVRTMSYATPGAPASRASATPAHTTMHVTIKTPEEQEKMRVAGRLAAEVLDMIGPHVVAGRDHRGAGPDLPRSHRRTCSARSRRT